MVYHVLRLNNWVLYDLYDEDDMRNSKYNIKRRFYYNNPDFDYSQVDFNYQDMVPYETIDTLGRINPYSLKWGHFDPTDVFGFGMWKDFILMRLGETYLLKAEAQVMQNDLDERARELIAEENRRMTLMRTGMLVERATRLNLQSPSVPLPDLMRIEGL